MVVPVVYIGLLTKSPKRYDDLVEIEQEKVVGRVQIARPGNHAGYVA